MVTDTIFGAPANSATGLHPAAITPHARTTIRLGRDIATTGAEGYS